MSKAEEVKLHIMVVINRQKNKVLFAEAGSDFTDVLLSFLLLPLGTIMKVLQQHYGEKTPAIGSLNTLYKSVANLDTIYFEREEKKQNLLIPQLNYENKFCKLKLDVKCTQPKSSSSEKSYDGVFTKSSASFIISDDLKVLPSVAGSIMETLSTLGIAVADMDGTETRNVTFGLNEMMGLLKESLISLNPLTALVFPGSQMIIAREGHNLVDQIDQNVASKNPKKMILKAMMQKSTNKFLYAQADYQFINFLFGTLILPLGEVEWYLDSNYGVMSMDNLHKSIHGNLNSKHLMTDEANELLLNPYKVLSNYYRNTYFTLNFDPKNDQCHVRGSGMYMVSDDLTISPLGVTSGLSVINELKISLSDVKEVPLQVGLEEKILFDTNKRMSKAEEVKFHIKVVINREKNKVLFAEAGSDFTDVLLSFLLLPLGTIVKVLEQHYGEKTPAIGSLNTLYRSVANLDSIHFKQESFKQEMLIPNLYCKNRSCELKLNINCTHPTSCSSEKSYAGVFTKSSASFIISDDLKVLPSVAGSIIETLSTLSIAMADMDGVETRNVTFGLNEIMGLLKESLISRNPLTALVFPGSRMILEREGHISVNQIDQTVASKNPKKMIVKAMMQKSTNKFLYAQVDKHFINFLFGTLTIPLGKVESYLDSNSGVTTMDNLQGSIPGLNSNHLMTRGAYNALFCQELISYYLYVNEYIPLNFDPNRHQRHVKGSRMYMVSDDLTVSPLGVTSGLSVINELKISLSDVDELQLQVGLEEGLSILKAALTSTTALTDSLFEPMKKKVPKQEK